jgi:ribosomal protein S12 methylthiotransferase accessory factor
VETALQEKKGLAEPFPVSRACTPATQQIAWNVAATEVAAWIARGESLNLEGQILTLDVRTWKTQTHTLVCLPSCPACGVPVEPGERPAPPVVLRSRKKTFVQDGGHRTLSPEATLDRFGHHVSPITGAVSRLERQGISHDGVMHAYTAGFNAALPLRTLADLDKSPRHVCGGKGASDAQAKASGLCEALERYSGIFRGDEPCRRDRIKDLGDAGLHPNACMRFSDRQYQNRDASNALALFGCFVPKPFDEEAEIDWAPVWSLTRREHRFLPTEYCYFDYPVRDKDRFCCACSNGAAAGNTLEEAILQGFLELVERDSVALWWYNRLRKPAVDLDSFDEPYLSKLRTYLRRRHRDLWVLDLTSDLQIPAFAAVSRYTDRQPEQILLGFGAHLDARIAVLRAVTELNQFLAWLTPLEQAPPPNGAARPQATGAAMGFGDWLKTATLANQPYLIAAPDTSPRLGSDYPQTWADDLKEDVLTCQALVERHGMEMLVLDQTRPDIGLPVAKVFVPGLRHFRPRFAPGRLYDVPLRSGWLAQPLTEEQFNPIPMFL